MRCSCSGADRQDATRHPAADRLALGAGRHQSEHQVAEQVLLVRVDAGVDRLGRSRHGAADAAGLGVPRHRQRAALTALPGLHAGRGTAAAAHPASRRPRRRGGRPGPASISRPDCRAGASMASRSDCSLMPPSRWRPRSTSRAKRGVDRHLGDPVGAQRHDHGPGPMRPLDAARRGTRSRSPSSRTARRPPRTGRRPARTPARGPAAATSDRMGCSPGVTTTTVRPSRRSVAATPARTSEDLPQPEGPTTVSEPVRRRRSRQTSRSGVAAEERLGVVDVVRPQALVRAGRAGR